MIVTDNKNTIERGGADVVESNFKIKATGKAFKILSDGLYSDKPLAVVRELCCNAFDAHVANGNTNVPFELHLPTYLEPHLSIKDYGVGLSREQVEEIFTTYFESTKSESNDYIGALGLGSKSPFSYVDSFTVISRYNGIKYSFNAFINEFDIPSIALLFEQHTDEPNGLEVTMPVKQGDFSIFREKAETVLEWFEPRPKLTGETRINIKNRSFSMSGTGWKLEGRDENRYSYWHSHSSTAVQGKIGYPLDMYLLKSYLSPAQQAIINAPFVIEFPIGELEVSASREHLSYKTHTIESIKKRCDLIIAELPSKFQSRIDECKNFWEAKICYRDIITRYSVMHNLASSANLVMTWKGKDVDRSDFSFVEKHFTGLSVQKYISHRSTGRYEFTDEAKTFQYTLSPDKSFRFYRNDLKIGSAGRCRFQVNNHTDETIILLTGDDALIDKFIEQAGTPEIKNVSELAKPPVKIGVSRTSFQKLHDDGYRIRFNSLTSGEEIDIDEGGIFVPLYRNVPRQDDNKEVAINDFQAIIRNAKDLGIMKDSETIYGVTPMSIKDVRENTEWKSLLPELKERFNKWLTKNKLADQLAYRSSYDTWHATHGYYAYWLTNLAPHRMVLGVDHSVIAFNTQREKASTVNVDTATLLATQLGITAQTTGGVTAFDFGKEWDLLRLRYPMMQLVGRYLNTDQVPTLIEYIKTIDSIKS